MKNLGRPLAKVAELNGLTEVPEVLDGRPLTDRERGVVSQHMQMHILYRGIPMAPAEGLDSVIFSDGIKAYEDLAQPLNDLAARLGISPDGAE